jgi:hypothetical protein
MQAEPDAPVYAADQIEIAADPAQSVTPSPTSPAGPAGCRGASIAAAEPLAVGARFREKRGLVTMRSELLQVDPPRALARTWKVSALRTEAIEHWALEQRDGVTFARTEQSWRGPLPRLLPCPMRSMLAQEQANSHKLPIAAKHSSHSSTRSSPRRPRAEPSSRHSPGPGSSSKTPRSARLATS